MNVAFLTALRAPERVDRLAAFNIIHPWTEIGPPTPGMIARASYQYVLATPVLGEAAQKVGGRAIQELLRRGAGKGFEFDDGALDLYAGAFTRGPHARAASALYRTFLLRELPALTAGKYGNRRLGVAGVHATSDGDPVVGAERLEGLTEHAPDMTTHVIPGAGHWTPDERPDEVTELIRA